MTITALPTPPSPSDSPAAFNSKAFDLLGALPTFVTEANALEPEYAAAAAAAANGVLASKVTGPASSTDNTLPRFDGTTGKLIKGSGVTVDDSGKLTNSASSVSVASFNGTSGSGAYVTFENSAVVYGDIGTASQTVGGSVSDFSINARGARNLIFGTNNTERARIDTSGRWSVIGGFVGCQPNSSGVFFGGEGTLPANGSALSDNSKSMGSASYRWSQVYAAIGTINTSDAREKTAVRVMAADEVEAAKALSKEIGTYQFLASVEVKGDKARHHIGMTVQRAIELMKHYGLDPFAYGFICYDKWKDEFNDVASEDGAFERSISRQAMQAKEQIQQSVELVNGVPTLVKKTQTVMEPVVDLVQVVDENGQPLFVEVPAVVDEDGNETAPAHLQPMQHPVPRMEEVTERYDRVLVRAAGDRYSFRYDQLNLFIARGLEARLMELEPA